MKVIKENMRLNFCYLQLGDGFLEYQKLKWQKTDKLDSMETKHICVSKDTTKNEKLGGMNMIKIHWGMNMIKMHYVHWTASQTWEKEGGPRRVMGGND